MLTGTNSLPAFYGTKNTGPLYFGGSAVRGIARAGKQTGRTNNNGSRYFDVSETGEVSATGKRPGSQNYLSVQRKSARVQKERIQYKPASTEQFIEEVGRGVPLSEMNAGEGVDMAHVISADELRNILINKINAYRAASRRYKKDDASAELERFTSGFITTDAEDEENVRQLARSAARGDLKAADRLLARLNRVSRNLMGGDASINRSIGQRRDIPLDSLGGLVGYIAKRIELADAAWGGGDRVPSKYTPRRTEAGGYFSSTR